MFAVFLIVWLLCGFGAMAVAQQRGGSGCAGLALGFFLGPLGLALAFAVFDGRQCPQCRSTIPANAERCPKCQANLAEPPRATAAAAAPGDDPRTVALVRAIETGAPFSAPALSTDDAPPTKKCPDCAEDVRAEARKCRFCGYLFPDSTEPRP